MGAVEAVYESNCESRHVFHLCLLLASCGSSSGRSIVHPPTPTTLGSFAGRDALAFREVLAMFPYKAAGAPPTSGSCPDGMRVTPPALITPVARIVLPDAKKRACYLLGPTLLTGRDIDSAPTINQGITGRDVAISGQFDEATARAIARSLS